METRGTLFGTSYSIKVLATEGIEWIQDDRIQEVLEVASCLEELHDMTIYDKDVRRLGSLDNKGEYTASLDFLLRWKNCIWEPERTSRGSPVVIDQFN
ncbi:hypothetical protein BGZ83_008273 [Gryganskiella cystojenkinii]|nr:hypothetical protein BGZ83_008273 [Gryganskiella cystojenkinii]